MNMLIIFCWNIGPVFYMLSGNLAGQTILTESVTMTRLRELQVKSGVARQECFSRRQVVNCHRAGVVSCFMLGYILKRRSEHGTEEFDEDNLSTNNNNDDVHWHS
jgi:hypothetical protein